MQILIATRNPGKLREFRELLGPNAGVVSLDDLNLAGPPEDGKTFEANAELKARHAARLSDMLTVADDSGLEVEALGGAPGVYSARYAGPEASDQANRSLLLDRLRNVPPDQRAARFVSVISICTPSEKCESFRGEWEGAITRSARGSGGFGYDPVFELGDGRTVAELPPSEKNLLSHRAMALKSALPYLKALIDAE